jgi:hypothetical protein
MQNYAAYARATNRLCAQNTEERENNAHLNDQLRRLHQKISQSHLTVYQKGFLLQQLSTSRETAHP